MIYLITWKGQPMRAFSSVDAAYIHVRKMVLNGAYQIEDVFINAISLD